MGATMWATQACTMLGALGGIFDEDAFNFSGTYWRKIRQRKTLITGWHFL